MSDNPDDEHNRESSPNRSVVVVIPTYNERENLASILDRVRVSVPDAHVLVVDDNSPDGTGTLADELAAEDAHIHVLHRTEKKGLGAAYIAGFRWALDEGLRRIGLENLQSQGYSFQVDLTVRALRAGLVVIELPITFVQRALGSSKMNGVIVVEALWRVTLWGLSGGRKRDG